MITNLPISFLSPAASTVATGPSAAVSADVSRFNQAMAAPVESPDPIVQTLNVSSVAAPINAKPSLGDSIISGLKSASDDIHAKWAHVTEALAGQDLTVTDALRLQMSVMQASVQYELMSKGISKTVQNLDQTLKTQ
jgi:hypothetical protein